MLALKTFPKYFSRYKYGKMQTRKIWYMGVLFAVFDIENFLSNIHVG